MIAELKRLFVTRPECYCIQTANGYTKMNPLLADEVLSDHLAGKTTVGSYQLSKENLVKWLCFDLDPEKLENPKEPAQKLLSVMFEEKQEEDVAKTPRICPNCVLLEASRFADQSFHIWVFFSPEIHAKVARWVGLRILEIAGSSPKSIEVFPKQVEVTRDRPYGNFVKLPLGFHQVERKWSRILDFNTFEPLANEDLQNKHGLSFSEADQTKIMNFQSKTDVQIAFDLPKTFKPLSNREEEKAIRFLCKYWAKGHRNELEMYFLGLCLKRGVRYESTQRIIEEVIIRTNDEEKQVRLELLDYHYRNRLKVSLKGKTGIREIIEEIYKN